MYNYNMLKMECVKVCFSTSEKGTCNFGCKNNLHVNVNPYKFQE